MRKGALLASGGIDSTVLLYQLARDKKLSQVLFCNYGQASSKHCHDLVSRHAYDCGVPFTALNVVLPRRVQGNHVPGVYREGFKPDRAARMPLFNSRRELVNWRVQQWSWIEGRNTAFILQAAIQAAVCGDSVLYTAFQFDDDYWEDPSRWGDSFDTSPQYVAALNNLFEVGAFLAPMEVVAPYLDQQLNKKRIVAKGARLGVDFSRTYSCEFFPACSVCDQCQVRFDILGGRA